MSPLDDTAYHLQWTKKVISAGLYQLHIPILGK